MLYYYLFLKNQNLIPKLNIGVFHLYGYGVEQDYNKAIEWFEKAASYFKDAQWEYCWVREANEMYIKQCRDKPNH